jgi:glutamate transport system permease protein
MSASVLFDSPGPRTRRRHRLYSVLFTVAFVAVVALVVWKLAEEGNFEAELWEDLFAENVWSAIMSGIQATLTAAGIAIVCSVLLGALLVTGRVSDHWYFRVPATAVIEFFRAIPLLLLIIFLFLFIGPDLGDNGNLIALVVGLTLYNGSVLAEVFRAGLNAVPRGQSEAAYAIGLRKTGVMTAVLAPQAVRFMLPAIISQCVVVLKDTSLGFVVAYPELVREGKGIAEYVNNNLMTYLLIAVIYVAMNSVVALLATWLETRIGRRGRGAAKQVHAVEEALPMT